MSKMSNEELVAAIQEGHTELMEVLITLNINLVRNIAHRMNIPGVPFEDRVQDGCIGMMEAVPTFDASKGLKFSTHATQRIRAKILRDGNEQSHMIRLPANMVEMKMKVMKFIKAYIADTGKRPNAQYVAKTLKLNEDDVAHIMAMPGAAPMSLDVSVGDDEDGNVIGAVGDALGGVALESELWRDSRIQVIISFLDELPEIEQTIVSETLGLTTGVSKTMRELDRRIANEMGQPMSYTTINIRYNKAIEYIKARIAGEQIIFTPQTSVPVCHKNASKRDVIILISQKTQQAFITTSLLYSQEPAGTLLAKLRCDSSAKHLACLPDAVVLQYTTDVLLNDLDQAETDAREAVTAMGFVLLEPQEA